MTIQGALEYGQTLEGSMPANMLCLAGEDGNHYVKANYDFGPAGSGFYLSRIDDQTEIFFSLTQAEARVQLGSLGLSGVVEANWFFGQQGGVVIPGTPYFLIPMFTDDYGVPARTLNIFLRYKVDNTGTVVPAGYFGGACGTGAGGGAGHTIGAIGYWFIGPGEVSNVVWGVSVIGDYAHLVMTTGQFFLFSDTIAIHSVRVPLTESSFDDTTGSWDTHITLLPTATETYLNVSPGRLYTNVISVMAEPNSEAIRLFMYLGETHAIGAGFAGSTLLSLLISGGSASAWSDVSSVFPNLFTDTMLLYDGTASGSDRDEYTAPTVIDNHLIFIRGFSDNTTYARYKHYTITGPNLTGVDEGDTVTAVFTTVLPSGLNGQVEFIQGYVENEILYTLGRLNTQYVSGDMGTFITEEPVPEPIVLTPDSGRDPTLRQRLVNMYTEPTPKGPTKYSRYQRPGLEELAELGDGPVRVTFKWGDYRFTVSGNEVYRDSTLIGTVFGSSAPVRFAYSDEEIVVVSGGTAWYVTTSSVIQITDPDLPNNVVDVAFLAGRFIYVSSNDTTFYWSDLNDARTIGGLDFATAAENTKDICVAVTVLADQLVFFTRKVTEFWSPSTNPDSPYIRSPGRKTDLGLGARHSVVLMDNALIFVGFDKQVYRTGAVPLKISNFEVDDYLRQATQEELEEDCHAFTVNFGGHEFYVVYIPNNGSWAYDLSMKEWAEWRSWNRGRFRSMCAEDNFMGDFYTGKIMGFNGGRFIDVEGTTEPIERVINYYRPLEDGRVPNTNIVLSCTRGTTTLLEGHGSDPICEMAFSDDEGRTYSDWRGARLGMQGERTDYAKAVWQKLGRIRPPGRHYLFRCTDPVRWSPFGVGINVKRP